MFVVLYWYVLHIECGQRDNCLTKNVGSRRNMSKSYEPNGPKEPLDLEGRIFRHAQTENQFDDGVQTAPTLDGMVTLNTSPNTRRRYSMSVKIAATDHTRRQFANTYHQVPHVGWASTVLLTCSGMCRYALGRQSHEDSGHINGVFDPTVDKAVNLIDSEMTVARELTEDFVTVIVAGVGTGSNILQATGTVPDPSSSTDHLHAARHDPLILPRAERPAPDHRLDEIAEDGEDEEKEQALSLNYIITEGLVVADARPAYRHDLSKVCRGVNLWPALSKSAAEERAAKEKAARHQKNIGIPAKSHYHETSKPPNPDLPGSQVSLNSANHIKRYMHIYVSKLASYRSENCSSLTFL
ncbi:uncharacterized protein LW94_8253 [Fusarium fujikuroi]|nr:uncharacterized protein LW94_8253 [Fusarium fujikuroi]